MNHLTRFLALVAAASALPLLGSSAFAIPVVQAGGPFTLPGTSIAQRPELAGVTIYSADVNFSTNLGQVEIGAPNDIETGTLHTWIVRETNAGTLDFYYRAEGITSGADGPTRVALSGLPNDPSLDVDYLGPGAPSNVATYNGDTLSVQSEEVPFFIHTNQVDFNSSPSGVAKILFVHGLTGPGADDLSVVVPGSGNAPPVPEPASLALLPLAITALGLRMRWRSIA